VAAEVTANWERTENLRVEGLLAARQAERARRILGTRLTLHPPAADGQIPFTLTCRALEDVRQLLPFADEAIVTRPAEARAHLRELAARTLARYARAARPALPAGRDDAESTRDHQPGE